MAAEQIPQCIVVNGVDSLPSNRTVSESPYEWWKRVRPHVPNAQGKQLQCTEDAEDTNTGHENAKSMDSIRVRLTDQLGRAHLANQGGKALCFMLVQPALVESESDVQ